MSRLDRMERNAAGIYAIVRVSDYVPEPVFSIIELEHDWI